MEPSKINKRYILKRDASQWILLKAYTLGSSIDAIHETDGSISFIIDSFTSRTAIIRSLSE